MMVKRAIFYGLFFMVIPLIGAENIKIGYVDSTKVASKYEKMEKYRKELEEEIKEKDKILEDKREAIKKMQDKLDTLKGEARSKEEEEIARLARDFKKTENEMVLELTKKRNEKFEEIAKDIKDTIEDYAKKKGYTFILDERYVLYGDKKLDVTEEIIKLLNNKYKQDKK